MIGILLVTHGRIGHEMVRVAEDMLGKKTAVKAFEVKNDDDLEQCRLAIGEIITKLNDGQGVLILTDMYGSTPSNLALKYLASEQVEMLTGLNMPMLVKILRCRDHAASLDELAKMGYQAAQKYINIASQTLDDDRQP